MEPVSKDRLRCALYNLLYVERDAWRIGEADVPEMEKKLLSQRTLGDIQYVEKEAFDIERGCGDSLYVDGDTAEEERVRRLRDRIVEMWEKWHPGELEDGSAVLLKPQKQRRGQKSPANEAKEASSSEPHFLERWLFCVLISTAAFVSESRASQVILQYFPRRFIRSLEGAPADGALLLEDFFDPYQESLGRHLHLENNSSTPPFMPIEIKCVSAHLRSQPQGQASFTWRADFRRDPIRHRITMIISPADPDHVILYPLQVLL